MRNLINANLKSDNYRDLHRAVVAGIGGLRVIGVQPLCVFTQGLVRRAYLPGMKHHAMSALGAPRMLEQTSSGTGTPKRWRPQRSERPLSSASIA